MITHHMYTGYMSTSDCACVWYSQVLESVGELTDTLSPTHRRALLCFAPLRGDLLFSLYSREVHTCFLCLLLSLLSMCGVWPLLLEGEGLAMVAEASRQ